MKHLLTGQDWATGKGLYPGRFCSVLDQIYTTWSRKMSWIKIYLCLEKLQARCLNLKGHLISSIHALYTEKHFTKWERTFPAKQNWISTIFKREWLSRKDMKRHPWHNIIPMQGQNSQSFEYLFPQGKACLKSSVNSEQLKPENECVALHVL